MRKTDSNTDLYQRIAEVTRGLHCTSDAVDSVVQRIAEYAAAQIPGAEYAGVTLATSECTVETPAATHPFAALLDVVQQRHHEGPCLTAAWQQHIVRVDDLVTEERWPHYRHDALEMTPIRSIMSFPLSIRDRTMGALNVYAGEANVFDAEAEETGYLLGALATLAWDSVRREGQFQSALATRDVIGQAKGILMARFDISADRAFELMKRLSQEGNVKLVDLARRVVALPHLQDL